MELTNLSLYFAILFFMLLIIVSFLYFELISRTRKEANHINKQLIIIKKLHTLSVEYISSIYECVLKENDMLHDLHNVNKNIEYDDIMKYHKDYVKRKIKSFNYGQKVFDKRFGIGSIIDMNFKVKETDTEYYILVAFFDKKSDEFFTKYYYQNGNFFKNDKRPRLQIYDGK